MTTRNPADVIGKRYNSAISSIAAQIEGTKHSLPEFDPRSSLSVRRAAERAEDVYVDSAAYLVHQLYNALGFDPHRVFRWRLEHKLVQALVFRRYVGAAYPRTAGLYDIAFSMADWSLEEALSVIFPEGYFFKEALGDSSGAGGDPLLKLPEACLKRLDRGLKDTELTLTDERFIMQERLSIIREYRVHTVEGHIVPDLIFDRYGRFEIRAGMERVGSFMSRTLAMLPTGLLKHTICGWDIAELPGGQFRIVEVNFCGFHPEYRKGFQCSGFFNAGVPGLLFLMRLFEFCERQYAVKLRVRLQSRRSADYSG